MAVSFGFGQLDNDCPPTCVNAGILNMSGPVPVLVSFPAGARTFLLFKNVNM